MLAIADTGRETVTQVANTSAESELMAKQVLRLEHLVGQFKYQ